MLERQIAKYESRIAEEEGLAKQANSPEAALANLQAAMLYRTEVSILRRKRRASLADTLAEVA